MAWSRSATTRSLSARASKRNTAAPPFFSASFVAALELARQGKVEMRQKSPFAPLYLKAPGSGAAA